MHKYNKIFTILLITEKQERERERKRERERERDYNKEEIFHVRFNDLPFLKAYELPKIHTKDFPFRLIMSYC